MAEKGATVLPERLRDPPPHRAGCDQPSDEEPGMVNKLCADGSPAWRTGRPDGPRWLEGQVPTDWTAVKGTVRPPI
jgi:hypothetical protein